MFILEQKQVTGMEGKRKKIKNPETAIKPFGKNLKMKQKVLNTKKINKYKQTK